MTVRIVTDSSCDLPDPLVSELGIDVVPLTIRFGSEELVDRRDLTPAELSATGESAQAAARAVADVVPVKVVDSLSVSLGHGMMAVQGARRAAAGATLDEIVAMAED